MTSTQQVAQEVEEARSLLGDGFDRKVRQASNDLRACITDADCPVSTGALISRARNRKGRQCRIGSNDILSGQMGRRKGAAQALPSFIAKLEGVVYHHALCKLRGEGVVLLNQGKWQLAPVSNAGSQQRRGRLVTQPT